jgi:hypothetical protein
MEFAGALVIGYCLWIAQALNDSQKKQEQEIEKRVKEKLQNQAHFNIQIVEKN